MSCKYYQGELTCPKRWEKTKKGNFGYGEMIFCKEQQNIIDFAPKYSL